MVRIVSTQEKGISVQSFFLFLSVVWSKSPKNNQTLKTHRDPARRGYTKLNLNPSIFTASSQSPTPPTHSGGSGVWVGDKIMVDTVWWMNKAMLVGGGVVKGRIFHAVSGMNLNVDGPSSIWDREGSWLRFQDGVWRRIWPYNQPYHSESGEEPPVEE